MCKVAGAFFLLIGTAVLGLPAEDALMLDLGDDTAVVESTVREARAVVPEHIEDLLHPGVKEAFLHTYGDKQDGEGDVQGYHKKSRDKGSDGYKHFDSYHKKDGDKYGFETHSEYGKANKASAGATGKSQKYTEGYDKNSDAERNDDQAETKKSYQVVEDVHENKKGVRAVEDYDGDSGYYVDSGDSEGHTDAQSENYSDGDESAGYTEGGEGEHYEGGYDEGDGHSGHYTASDGDNESYTAAEYDDGESQAYTAEEDY
ncbi:keratin, type I cytoskeletal 9-like [Asbolus verrucosus]|uniref:Keratin, type I cytoskeletal 9-like n=1 Tax=Asbolus verrucosus TaxID=1661398 RepID=A0A482VNV3_ASBVE|nr:keratin, type I cytoskeletal 9-like [Asbolus verrucosus]